MCLGYYLPRKLSPALHPLQEGRDAFAEGVQPTEAALLLHSLLVQCTVHGNIKGLQNTWHIMAVRLDIVQVFITTTANNTLSVRLLIECSERTYLYCGST